MTDLDSRLSAALEADAPPVRDVLFRVELLLRLDQARFRRRVALTMTVTSVVAAIAAMNAPAIEAWLAEDARRTWIVGLGAAAAVLAPAGALLAASPGLDAIVRACRRWVFGHEQSA